MEKTAQELRIEKLQLAIFNRKLAEKKWQVDLDEINDVLQNLLSDHQSARLADYNSENLEFCSFWNYSRTAKKFSVTKDNQGFLLSLDDLVGWLCEALE